MRDTPQVCQAAPLHGKYSGFGHGGVILVELFIPSEVDHFNFNQSHAVKVVMLECSHSTSQGYFPQQAEGLGFHVRDTTMKLRGTRIILIALQDRVRALLYQSSATRAATHDLCASFHRSCAGFQREPSSCGREETFGGSYENGTVVLAANVCEKFTKSDVVGSFHA
jgi:hypothetical protein